VARYADIARHWVGTFVGRWRSYLFNFWINFLLLTEEQTCCHLLIWVTYCNFLVIYALSLTDVSGFVVLHIIFELITVNRAYCVIVRTLMAHTGYGYGGAPPVSFYTGSRSY